MENKTVGKETIGKKMVDAIKKAKEQSKKMRKPRKKEILPRKPYVMSDRPRKKRALETKPRAKRGALSEEHKQKIGIANTGKIRTDETKQNISDAKTGQFYTMKERDKMYQETLFDNKPVQESLPIPEEVIAEDVVEKDSIAEKMLVLEKLKTELKADLEKEMKFYSDRLSENQEKFDMLKNQIAVDKIQIGILKTIVI